jgi:hypothetical protein
MRFSKKYIYFLKKKHPPYPTLPQKQNSTNTTPDPRTHQIHFPCIFLEFDILKIRFKTTKNAGMSTF